MGRFITFIDPPEKAVENFPQRYRCSIKRYNKYTSHALKDHEISSLKPDLEFEKWIPAPITPLGERISIQHYNKEKFCFPGSFKQFLFDSLDEDLVPALGLNAFKPLESLQAVKDHIPSDSLKAACGLPHALAGIVTKEIALQHPQLQAWFLRVFNEPLPVYIYSIALKNELRPEIKALENKIRTFCIANIEHMIVSLKYFANFADSLVRICGKRFSYIGFSQYHGEWHRTIQKYLGYHCWAKDGSKFDYHMFSQIMYWLFEWFGGHANVTDDLQYQILTEMTVNKTVVSMQGLVFLATGSNPSGHYLTAIFNTLFNHALNLYAFWRHCADMKPRQVRRLYHKIMLEACLGDDSLEGVLLEYSKFYNETIQIRYLQEILDFTTQSKPGSVIEQDFLSLRTTVDPVTGNYVPYPFTTRWWSSLDYSFKELEPAHKLDKLNSMRVHAYYNKVAFHTITNVIRAYMSKHSDLIGNKSWDDATRNFISESSIRRLYHSYE